MKYIYDYITDEEYKCPHCKFYPPDFFVNDIKEPFRDLFHKFKMIRKEWGTPILITSGYRCPFHNNEIGGSLASVHMFGLAFDLLPREKSIDMLFNHVENMYPELRIGKYSTHIHIDNGYKIKPRASHTWQEGARWRK